MKIFELIIFLLLCGSALSVFALKIGAPYPVLLSLAGAAIAMLPGMPSLVLDPELALVLFIAPVLLDAAYSSSPRDLERNWKPVVSLAVGAVVITVLFVGLFLRWILPEISWPVAIALGAVVAPPDAAAATTVLKQLKIPHRLMVILEGESLFNDASALLVFRLAVATALTGAVSTSEVVQTFFAMSLVSVFLGIVLAYGMTFISSQIKDISVAIVVQFCGTFAVWIVAERLHLSGIITMVVFAMVTARKMPGILKAETRVPTWAVWQVAVFVLNVLAFVLVGFQIRLILERISPDNLFNYMIISCSILAVVIVARVVWVSVATLFDNWRCTRNGEMVKGAGGFLSVSETAVIGWSGMRGTVTLASALALPIDFPYRDLILLAAFVVTLGTLTLQGLTLKPLIIRLKLKDDDTVEKEMSLARVRSLEVALKVLDEQTMNDVLGLVKGSFEIQLRKARLGQSGRLVEDNLFSQELAQGGVEIKAALQAQRKALLQLRNKNTIGDSAFQAIEEEIDWMELGWAQILPIDFLKNNENA